MEIDTHKLEELFAERYRTLGAKPTNDVWVDYCDKHKIITIHGGSPSLSVLKSMVLIDNCGDNYNHPLLVPKDFAEKCLVLGGLP